MVPDSLEHVVDVREDYRKLEQISKEFDSQRRIPRGGVLRCRLNGTSARFTLLFAYDPSFLGRAGFRPSALGSFPHARLLVVYAPSSANCEIFWRATPTFKKTIIGIIGRELDGADWILLAVFWNGAIAPRSQ